MFIQPTSSNDIMSLGDITSSEIAFCEINISDITSSKHVGDIISGDLQEIT